MRELFIPKCWIYPSFKSLLYDLFSVFILLLGVVVMLLKFKDPLPFVWTFLNIRAFTMGIVEENYFKKG